MLAKKTGFNPLFFVLKRANNSRTAAYNKNLQDTETSQILDKQ